MLTPPPARVVDVALLAAVTVAAGSGLVAFLVGRPPGAWVVVLHGVAGLLLLPLLYWKLRRVGRRLTRTVRWDRSTAVSAFLLVVALATVGTGLAWVAGASFGLAAWTGLSVHVGLGLLLVAVLIVHLRSRLRLPTAASFARRRRVLETAALVATGALAWRVTQLVGGERRFTGSRPTGGTGNAFPATSWVADDPDPIDPAAWRLDVGGATERALSLRLDDFDAGESREATLDCTSGWYADRTWTGVGVDRLLAAAEPLDSARWVRFRSVTGYRWSLPLEEARGALLATAVDGEVLSHGHGFPLRLVAPGRRGFQWVKWVTAVEVTEESDPGQWLAIFTSWLGGDRQT